MNKFGGWNVNVPHDKFPQKVASAISNLDNLVGCSYKAVAYLGTQEVNGTNHAVLAQQTVMTGKDANNAVVIVFNEKRGVMDLAVTDIKRIVESGGELGGTNVNMSTTLPEEASEAFKAAFFGIMGFRMEPIAYVGSKVENGTQHIIIAEYEAMTLKSNAEIVIVSINTNTKKINVERVFELGSNDVDDDEIFSYAFNWLKK